MVARNRHGMTLGEGASSVRDKRRLLASPRRFHRRSRAHGMTMGTQKHPPTTAYTVAGGIVA
jgi:hypothetical protein